MKIAKLNDENLVLRSRISVLQNRLVSTLDTLDSVKDSNTAELLQECDTNTLLRQKISSYIHTLKIIEDERDELRSVVYALVEKGVLILAAA